LFPAARMHYFSLLLLRGAPTCSRAVYREADLYLLDDPLSAVDTHVGKHLFDECIVKLLADKARILVTHQVQYLADVSRIAILSNGEIQMQGTFKELLNSDVDYAQMLHLGDEEEEAEEEVEQDKRPLMRALRQLRSSRRSSSRRSSRASVGSLTLGDEDDEDEEGAPTMERIEATTKGKVRGSLFLRYFLAGTNALGFIVVIFLFLAAQTAGSLADFFVGFWTNQEELRDYFTSSRNVTSPSSPEPLTSTNNFIYIYTAIIVCLFVLGFTRSFFFYWVCSRSSQALHDNMFANIIRATMHFFNTNPS
ncbi:ABC-transporter, subfamily C member 16, partial [Frankliniella occidentalis]